MVQDHEHLSSHLTSLRKKGKKDRKSKGKKARRKDRGREPHISVRKPKKAARHFNSHLTSLREKGKKDRKRNRRGQERKVGVVTRPTSSDYLAV